VPLTVADLADHMNTAAPGEDTQQHREMARALNTAVEETTRRTGMLDAATVTVSVSVGRGESSARLPYVRLASIGAATGPGGTIGDLTDADPLAGLLPVTAAGSWSVTVTGKPWPAALQQSALDWAAHLYDVQRAQTNPVDDDQPTPSPSFSLPNRVEELQRPYLLPGFG
jgi:hypothetical protein